ncbi:MAG: hypothetical protein ACHQRM_11550 [Bacteroidia bacterium]
MIRKGLFRFVAFLAFSNIFLSFCVTSLVFETSLALGQTLSGFRYSFFLFSATLCLYCFHRLYRFKVHEGPVKLTERHRWIQQHRILFYFIFLSSALCTVWSLVFSIPWRILPPLLPIALVSLGYTIPCVPWKGTWIRLRDIAGIKIILISMVLGLTTVLLPVLELGGKASLFQTSIFFVFLRRVCFIFAITLPFDIRDKDFDKSQGTATIPVILGNTKARLLSFLALGIFIILAGIQAGFLHEFPPAYFLALTLSALLSGWMIHKSAAGSPDLFYTYGLEGMMLVQCLLVFSAHTFWP